MFLICILLTRVSSKLNTSQPPTIRSLTSWIDLIKSFTNLLYFDITSISRNSVGRTQACCFRYYSCPEELTFKKKWSDFENLFYCRYLVPIWDGLCKISFLLHRKLLPTGSSYRSTKPWKPSIIFVIVIF